MIINFWRRIALQALIILTYRTKNDAKHTSLAVIKIFNVRHTENELLCKKNLFTL